MKVICGPTLRRAIVREVVLGPDGLRRAFKCRTETGNRGTRHQISTDAGQSIPHSGSVPSAAACGQNAAPV